jgi:Tubulin-tyrosine ligase family
MLWKGHKFHFRMYAMLQGNMRSFLYEKAFLLTAGLKYDCNSDDVNKHITNLSVNKKLPGHPGQIPVNVKEMYPTVRAIDDASLLTGSRLINCAACLGVRRRNKFMGFGDNCRSALSVTPKKRRSFRVFWFRYYSRPSRTVLVNRD